MGDTRVLCTASWDDKPPPHKKGTGEGWVTAGIVQGQPRLDLNYLEDFAAQTDMNCVLAEDGRFIEIQGTAEQEPFKPEEMDQMLKLATKGAAELVEAQKKALKLR